MPDLRITTSKTPSSDKSPHIAALLNLSHELRTPANAILGQVELLLSGGAGPVSGEMRASLGDIQRAAIDLSVQLSEVVAIAETLPCTEPSERRSLAEQNDEKPE